MIEDHVLIMADKTLSVVLKDGSGMITPDIEKSFWKKVQKPSDCWIWIGAKRWNGYGKLTIDNATKPKALLAHRLSYELHKGPIPKGKFVCHTCDNPICVNPEHLFIGTHQENMTDMVSKKRQTSGTKNGQAKLTEEIVQDIRNLFSTGNYSKKELAKIYSISHMHVVRIIKRERWKHI